MPEDKLDVITIGRASVDLYGQQIGSRLEDIGSFAKSVGGCPTNISVGTARLGLKSALITRVGAEQMGRFIIEQLKREGVETAGIVSDPDRLTALVLLAVEAEGVSPMIFYRTDCADMALNEADIDEAFIASARSIVVTGTHFSKPHSASSAGTCIAASTWLAPTLPDEQAEPEETARPRRSSPIIATAFFNPGTAKLLVLPIRSAFSANTTRSGAISFMPSSAIRTSSLTLAL